MSSILYSVKHFFFGVLFLLFLIKPPQSFAAINITISDIIKKEDYYELNAVVTGMSGSSKTFIEGMFTSPNDNNYFGYTLSKKGEWLIYDGSPDKTLVTENFIELFNDTPQKIYVKPDYQDKDYIGSGKYLVKLKRFTASGSPSDYSNTLDIDLVNTTPTSTPAPTTQTTPTTTTQVTPTSTQTSTPKISTVTPPPSTPTKSQTSTSTSKTTPTHVIPAQAGIHQVNSTSKNTSTPVIPGSDEFIPSISSGESRKQTVVTSASQSSSSPQVLSSSTSTVDTVIPALVRNPDSNSSPSSFPISDKNLFLVGMVTFSVSGGVLYFRLKNL